MGSIDFAAAYNKGAIAWALVILLPSNWRLRRGEQALCVLLVWLESVLLDQFKSSIMLVHVLVLGVLLIRKGRPFRKTLSGAMQAVFWAWGCTMLLGSVISVWRPAMFGGTALSCIASSALLLFACLWRCAGKTKEHEIESAVNHYRTALELSIMSYFSFVIPAMPIENQRLTPILILSLLGLLAIVYFFMRKMNRVAMEAQRMKMERELVEYRYSKTLGLRHYFMKLFALFGNDLAKRDMDGAIRHYEREIGPLYEEIVDMRDETRLASEGLQRLLSLTLRELRMHKNVLTDISIEAGLPIEDDDRLTRILTVWLDNAADALKTQQEGFFRFRMKRVKGKRLLVHVANSIDDESSNYHELVRSRETDRGFGLQMADGIIRSSPDMQHDSYLSRTEDYHKRLFIQQLVLE